MRYIFVGRITEEKGIQRLLEMTTQLVSKGVTNFRIDFYGKGVLVEKILHHPYFGTHLFYHSYLPKEKLFPLRQQAHYTLMPSLLLETFGLTALDSLSLGIPVIGPKKGGMAPFIQPARATPTYKELLSCVKHLCENFTQDEREKESVWSKRQAENYTSAIRVDKFRQLSKNCKKILFVSDYIADIGGIESFLIHSKKLLEATDPTYQIDLFGKLRRVTGRWRKLDLLVASLNIQCSYLIRRLLKKSSYDMIWLHSVQRWIGWLPLLILKRHFKKPIRVMYHDVGLFHPFPSRVFDEAQLQRSSTFRGYLGEGRRVLGWKRYIGSILLVIIKRLYSRLLANILRRLAEKHFVPSAYLIPYVEKLLGKGAEVEAWEHYVTG